MDVREALAAKTWWRRVFPPAEWVPGYQPKWLGFDMLAGVTLAAYAIPVALADAGLAGLPPVNGIYCYLFGLVAYALFGTSRQLAVGPTTAMSMLVGTTIAGLANGDAARSADLAALAAVTMAAMCLVAWIFRLSTLVNFISETILCGFKAGAALSIAMTQLPKLFGVESVHGSFFARLIGLVGELGHTNVRVLLFGLAALALLLIGGRVFPGRPVALVVVALSIVAITMTSLGSSGFSVIGELPRGVPDMRLPEIRFADLNNIAPLAFACLVLGYIEGISAARAIADTKGEAIDSHQELLALGAVNLAIGLGRGFPSGGGLSQSSVNEKAGSRSPLALVFAAVASGLCLIYFAGLLHNLPNVVLAAIVLVAVKGLIDVGHLRRLWRLSKFEFGVAMVALAGVLVFGILQGVILAALASVLMIIGRVAYPHVALLGRIPGTNRYSDLRRNPTNEAIPGALLFRVESDLVYFNCAHVHDTVIAAARAHEGPLRLAVCDLSTTPMVDVAGTKLLAGLDREFEVMGATFRIVGAHASVRDILRAAGLEELVGHVSRRVSLKDVVEEFERTGGAPLA